ncbi:LOW QUALITY PROTEIN: hypothetical protein Cgig2_012971 [Carnegiea gigantea]|uniref:Uncharacterized protein n=1 Tax=Carnegiea gigantea TaxID=171969 RepID=A0A9Q1K199_9CARY|nr:LOW QUALITY PROTEIN: hypothetical protein Cgig2_012971 [Carnegiea gigantea]
MGFSLEGPRIPNRRTGPTRGEGASYAEKTAIDGLASKPHDVRKYCEFHEQNDHRIAECSELRKALHELADEGQIDRFLKRGPRFLWRERNHAPLEPRDEECSTEVVATIVGESPGLLGKPSFRASNTYIRARDSSHGNNNGVWKLHVSPLRTTTSHGYHHLGLPEKGVISRKHTFHLVNPILSFGGQEVNPTKMICLPLHFRDKVKAKNLSHGCPYGLQHHPRAATLHKVKAVIAPYLLQLQFEANDGCVGTMQVDQCMAQECYLVSIRPLIEQTNERGPGSPLTIEAWSPHRPGHLRQRRGGQTPPTQGPDPRLRSLICRRSRASELSRSRIRPSRVETDNLDLASLIMVTYFSSTEVGSAESAGASDHDLASISTKARLAGHLLPGSLQLRLGCALRAFLLPVTKIPRCLEKRRLNVCPTSDFGRAPLPLCPLTKEPQPSVTPRSHLTRPRFVVAYENLTWEGSRTPKQASCHEESRIEPIRKENQ